jgi:DNA repair exonuclease SbcCD ATPase subunit
MGNGAFRDASAAIERAAMLEQENEQLRTELADMARLRVEVEELAKLRAEVEELRTIARTENEGAYVKRLSEEREELAGEVRTLRERLAGSERKLAAAELQRKRSYGLGNAVEPVLEKIIGLFRPK